MQVWCGVGPAIAVLVLGIGEVPGEPSTDFGTGKVFSHVLLCAENMALNTAAEIDGCFARLASEARCLQGVCKFSSKNFQQSCFKTCCVCVHKHRCNARPKLCRSCS